MPPSTVPHEPDAGQSSIEYAGVLLLTAIVIVFALALGVDGLLSPVFSRITSALG
jgi:Flp pilus assembly pilin Flp